MGRRSAILGCSFILNLGRRSSILGRGSITLIRLNLFFLLFWLEAPLGEQGGGNLPGVLQGGEANLSRDFFANLLRAQFGNQPVDLLAHLLRLKVADLFRRIDPDVHGLVVTNRFSRDELTVVRSAGFERDPFASGIWKLLVHGL